MVRYLSLFTPNAEDLGTPPSPEHMQQMGKLVEEQMKLGKLLATGGLKRADQDAFDVSMRGGDYVIDNKPPADWRKQMGYAIMQGESKEAVIADVKHFLSVTGGGKCQLIEITM